MSILIKGIDMPKEGHLIVRIYANEEVCEPTECAGVWGKVATAVSVLPHGRLIDADRLKADNPRHMSADVPYVTEVTVEEIIDAAPTVIEADELIET